MAESLDFDTPPMNSEELLTQLDKLIPQKCPTPDLAIKMSEAAWRNLKFLHRYADELLNMPVSHPVIIRRALEMYKGTRNLTGLKEKPATGDTPCVVFLFWEERTTG